MFSRIVLVLFGLLIATMSADAQTRWVQMESNLKQMSPHNLASEMTFEVEADKGTMHDVSFYLIGKNADALEKHLAESSNPKHPNYGKHLTRDEVKGLTTDFEGLEKVRQYIAQVNEQLSAEGAGTINITKETDSSITAVAPIHAWEQAFNTKFFHIRYTRNDGSSEMINRAQRYFLPEELAAHVRMVMGTVQMPVQLTHGPVKIGLKKMHPQVEKVDV